MQNLGASEDLKVTRPFLKEASDEQPVTATEPDFQLAVLATNSRYSLGQEVPFLRARLSYHLSYQYVVAVSLA